MGLFEIIAILLTLAAVFSFINHRWLHLPTTIGLMLIALIFSLGLIGLGTIVPATRVWAETLLASVRFDQTLLHGMLAFLLFAGALHIDINDLRQQYRTIAGLATIGVLISTLLVGGLTWLLLPFLGLHLPMVFCLLFGALISPTDPIAVLAILKQVAVPRSLEAKIAGESLFNDGVGVVVFLVVLDIAAGGHADAGPVLLFFVREAIGGGLLGLAMGWGAYRMLREVDNYQVEVLITLALASGGYAAAEAMHLSAPIAIVAAGLLIGNHGRSLAMSETTRHHLDTFWELTDEILNAVLFVLIGLEVMVLAFDASLFAAGLVTIPVVLLARLVSVSLPITLLRSFRDFSPHAVKILTWGGLRGGISVALALSLPPGPEREIILFITYTTVVFAILVQGLTINGLLARSGY